MNTETSTQERTPGSLHPACSASWTEYVWTEKGYVQCGHLEARAETVEAASAELEKQMASPMMPNKDYTT